MIYESDSEAIENQSLAAVSRQSISHHVFDVAIKLGHSFKLKGLICKYKLAGRKKGQHFIVILKYERVKQQCSGKLMSVEILYLLL